MRAAVLLALFFLGGCAGTKPYFEVGLGVQIDDQTDFLLRTERSWQCENPSFHAEAGLESRNQWRVGLHHQSWLLCGGPLNDKAETYFLDIRGMKKWGGVP